MPVCARGVSQPDGSILLALDPAATDLAACAYVVETGPEIVNSLLTLSAQDGLVVSAGLISCWAAAFGIRAIIQIVKGSSE